MRVTQTLVDVAVTGGEGRSVSPGEGATTLGVQETMAARNRKALAIRRARHDVELVMS
jgi:hypothetical protein